jgi:hypothetical protein
MGSSPRTNLIGQRLKPLLTRFRFMPLGDITAQRTRSAKGARALVNDSHQDKVRRRFERD